MSSSSPAVDDKPASTKKPGPKSKTGSKPAPVDHKFEIGDIVLARLRGYPPWRYVHASRALASRRNHVLEDVIKLTRKYGCGRLPTPRLYRATSSRHDLERIQTFTAANSSPPVTCTSVAQYTPSLAWLTRPCAHCCSSWLQNKDIKALSSSDISSFLSQSHRKASGGLREAYQTAQDPTEWDAQQEEIHKQQEEAEANVDELEDEDEGEDVVVKGGKRKREEPKKKKTAAAAAKKEEEPKSKKAKAAASKAGDKKKTAAATKAEGDEDPLASNPECEMPHWNEVFESVESYDSMTIEALQYSKIGKVMKKIMGLTTIPLNDKYELTKRAGKLMHQWQEFIDTANQGSMANGQKKTTRPVSAAAAAEEETPAPVKDKEDKPVDETPARTTESAPVEEKKEEEVEAVEEEKKGGATEEEKKEGAAEEEKIEEEGEAKTAPGPEPEAEAGAEKTETNGEEEKMQVDA
ncbi:hypothetical protein I309_01797 [Cryptococcus deuterogattii LA55]|nr:hypothetical protein I309_01797 [Cryptococcus deuterogattii LA55]KIR91328.1 hypothetical protein I304_04798 [Cryptococcus deuterogattii CBS 10090]